MTETTGAAPQGATGSIYDLGYRRYEGARLGRHYALMSLFSYSFLSVWGIGRSWLSKLFPFGLAVIALVPAFVFLAVAALAPQEFEIGRPEEYYGFISIVLALFCAVAAPDLIGRDQRQRTLALYFSRALSRLDYAGVKVGALTLSLFLVLVVPQIFLQLGNAVAAESLTDYMADNADVWPPLLASSVLVACFMSALAMAIAVQTPRRAFATGAVIAAFVIFTALGGIFVGTLSGQAQKYALLISPFGMLEALVYWLFGVDAPIGSDMEQAGLDGPVYLAATVGYTAIALGVVLRRVSRMSV